MSECMQKITTVLQNLSPSPSLSPSTALPPRKSPFKSPNALLPFLQPHTLAPSRNNPRKNIYIYSPSFALVARSTSTLILSLLLLTAVSNACNLCMLPSPPKPKPKLKPTPCPPTPAIPPPPAVCPRDTLKLGACVDLLGGVVGVVVGTSASNPCCVLLEGLANLEVALCLCTAIKANVLGIHLNVPIALSAIVSACGKSIPPGFKCE